MKTYLPAILFILLVPNICYSQYGFFYGRPGKKTGHLLATYTSYQDLEKTNSSSGAGASTNTDVDPSYDVELGLRVHKIYSITANYLQASGELTNRKSYSLGFKAHLPGFFLIGGNVSNLADSGASAKIVRTTLGFEIANTDVTDESNVHYNYIEAVVAAGLQFHFRSVFITGSAKLRSYIGDYVVGYGVGLGYEF